MSRALCVFVRAPERGRVKTRLAAAIGADAALRLYEAFLEDVVAAAAEAARRSGAILELAVAGAVDHPRIVELARRHGATIARQIDGDLGARMREAIARHAAQGRAVCIIGSDSPQLTGAQLARGFDALVEHDVVVGPSRDGGYWLIGARHAAAWLFEAVPWSTPAVLSITLERCQAQAKRAALLETSFDVDEAEDLEELRRWLQAAPAEVAPATRRLLLTARPREPR